MGQENGWHPVSKRNETTGGTKEYRWKGSLRSTEKERMYWGKTPENFKQATEKNKRKAQEKRSFREKG